MGLLQNGLVQNCLFLAWLYLSVPLSCSFSFSLSFPVALRTGTLRHGPMLHGSASWRLAARGRRRWRRRRRRRRRPAGCDSRPFLVSHSIDFFKQKNCFREGPGRGRTQYFPGPRPTPPREQSSECFKSWAPWFSSLGYFRVAGEDSNSNSK